MGITGLLPFLENASRKTHVAEFRGCTAAIDAYCWLHRGAFGCAEKLVRGEETNGYVLYCMKYIKLLQSYDIRPILVFDGQHLPAKKQTEIKRREQRKACRKKATDYLRLGKLNEARNYMRQCIDITHKMALALIKECRKNGIDCIVAPYEADAQLAFLNIKKMAHFIITEDSDLTLFGCNKILFKMDLQGCGTLVEADKINNCMKLRNDTYTFDKFRYMCILSGCDYLESLPGVGLKKALKFVTLTADPSIYNVLAKLPSYLNLSNIIVTNEYREAFMIAEATFKHQLVYDPVARKLVALNDPISCGTKLEYCKNAGDTFDSATAFQLALGNIDPFTHEVYDKWSPDSNALHVSSIWARSYQKPAEPVKKVPKLNAPDTKGTKIIMPIPTEEDDVEYDMKLQEELNRYNLVQQPEKKQKIEDERSPSPILMKTHIPFKKLSKFQRTDVDSQSILISRFFSSKTVQNDEVDHSDTLLTSIDQFTKQRNSLEGCDTENRLSGGARETNKNELDVSNHEDNQLTPLKTKFEFKKRKCGAKTMSVASLQSEIEREAESLQTIHIEDKNDVVENVCVVDDKHITRNSQIQSEDKTSRLISGNQSRAKVTPSRRLGLSRIKNKPDAKKQPTLLSLFNNMKK